MYKICVLVILFLIYSFLGWIIETTWTLIVEKKFVNRGFLIGPVVPIYGTGGMLIYLLAGLFMKKPIILFIMSMLVCSLLEYFTSYVMEKVFKTRWWDYSKRKFNINGRICLFNILCFGVMSMIIVYVANPFFLNIIHKIDPMVLKVVVVILSVLFIVDFGISTKIIYNFRGISKNVHVDSTEEVNSKVKEVLLSRGALLRRIAKSYPNFKVRRS